MAKKRKPIRAPKKPAPTVYSGIRHIVSISTGVGTYCEHCGEPVGFLSADPRLANSVNHYIEQHGYTLLHVGTETSRDDKGAPWHNTIAVLGK